MRLEGFDFSFDSSACERCNAHCCRGESGYIFVTREELEAIAHHLNISFESLCHRYVRQVSHRYSLCEMQEESDPKSYACVFLDPITSRCQIYPVRPKQCKTFPFWTQFAKNPKEVLNQCPATQLQ